MDRSMFDEQVRFRDLITKHDNIDGYFFNVKLLKVLFQIDYQVHSVKQDIWDSIDNNEYFSFEGLVDFLKQLRIYKTPDLDMPKYQILKRTAHYEVRKYAPFFIFESKGDRLSGSSGFNNITRYMFGNNTSSDEKIRMNAPVFTQASHDNLSDVSIQIVLPLHNDLNSLLSPNGEEVKIRKVEGIIAAVSKFSGKPTEEVVKGKEEDLRSALLKDGLKAKKGCLLAQYNDPRTLPFVMRNEVLIQLNDFTLE